MLLGHTQMKEVCKNYLLQIIYLIYHQLNHGLKSDHLICQQVNPGNLDQVIIGFRKTYKQSKTHTPATRLDLDSWM